MVETSAGGFHQPDFGELAADLIPAEDDTYDLGSEGYNWAAIWVAIAMVTSLVIGGSIALSNIDGVLYVNASTEINGSLFIDENLTVLGNLTMLGTIADFSNANVTASYFIGDGSQLHGIQHGSLVLFMLDNASDIAGSKILFTDIGLQPPATLSKAITSSGTEFQNWTTNDGVPNLHILVDGVNELHFHARVTTTGRKDTTIFWRLYQNDTSNNMNLLFTSEESTILTTAMTALDIHIATDEIDLNLSDRLTLQLVVNLAGSGGNPTVEIKIEGSTDSRVELVVPGANVGTFIPYTGAINNLDLGFQNFTTTGYYFGNGSGLTDISLTESDPIWSANYSTFLTHITWATAVNGTLAILADILGFNYYNSTDFSIADYFTSATILGFSYYNSTNPQTETDPLAYNGSLLWDYQWNATNLSYVLRSGDTMTGALYIDTIGLGLDVLNSADIGNFLSVGNDLTVGGFINFTGLIYGNGSQLTDITFTELDPLWSGNETNVAFKNEANVFTAGQSLTGQNITAIECVIFDSGGKICSGV